MGDRLGTPGVVGFSNFISSLGLALVCQEVDLAVSAGLLAGREIDDTTQGRVR